MNFNELLSQRRSSRNFLENRIEAENIVLLQKSLLLSPTGKRKNHWDFVFVENLDTLNKLSICKPHGASFIEDAALAVVIIGDSEKSDTWIEDCSIASILLQMQAEELGLGSCWVQVHKRPHNNEKTAEEFVKETLSIPQSKSVLSIIALGYPEQKKAPIDESELLYDRIHLESFQ